MMEIRGSIRFLATFLALLALSFTLNFRSTGVFAQLPPGTCQNFTSAPLSQCTSFVNYPVFVPTNLTIAAIDALAAARTGFFRLGKTSTECSDAALRFICAEAFRRCTNLTVAAPPAPRLAIPGPTCRSTCETFELKCADTIKLLAINLTDCESVSNSSGLPNYPVTGWRLPLSPSVTIPIACNNPAKISPYAGVPPARCEPFKGAPISQCGAVVDYAIYIPEGLTQEDIDSAADERAKVLRAGVVRKACTDAGLEYICSQAFRPCIYNRIAEEPIPIDVLLPAPTCRSSCRKFVSACSEDFAKLGLSPLLPNCSAIDTSGQPTFPKQSQTLNVGGVNITLPCREGNIFGNYSFVPYATCEEFNPTRASQCFQSGAIDYKMIYVAEGQSQEMFDRQVYDSTKASLYPIVPRGCTAQAMRLACAGTFLRCNEIPLNALPGATVVLPSPPCRSVCEATNEYCGQFLAANGRDTRDCNVPTFPVDFFRVSIGDQNVQIPCEDPPNHITVYRRCPFPFDREGEACNIPCPVPVYNHDQYLAMKITISIFAFLSLVTSILLILTYTLDREKRKFPVNMPLWISVAALGFSISFFFGIFTGFEYTICKNKDLCRTQAVFSLYFQFAMAGWMMLLAFNIFLTLLLRLKFRRSLNSKQMIGLQVIYHIIGWGIGVPIVIVALAVDKLGYLIPQLICFVTTDPEGWPIIGLYAIPILVIIVLTIFFTLLVIFHIYKVSRDLKQSFFKSLIEQRRVFLFLAVFLYIYLYNVEESISATINYDDNINGFQQWGACVFANDGPDKCSFKDTSTKLNYGRSYVFALNTSMQGFLINIIFLTSPSTFTFWRDRVKNLLTGKGFYGPDALSSRIESHLTNN